MTDPKWEDPRHVLMRYGIYPKRAFSQNFMIVPQLVEFIARASIPGEYVYPIVVELGAGLGTLTKELVRAGAKVYAVERDPDMLNVLSHEFADIPNVETVPANVERIDLATFCSEKQPRICVAGNIPYATTGRIVRNLVNYRECVERVVLTVQREVSDRLLAHPGCAEYGALTVFTAAAYEISNLKHLSAAVFYPPPKVRSSVIRLIPHPTPRATETQTFVHIVQAAFRARRKTLRNALLLSKGTEAYRIDQALERAEIDGQRRGETLSIEEFARLSGALNEI